MTGSPWGVEWKRGEEPAPRLIRGRLSDHDSFAASPDGSFGWLHGYLLSRPGEEKESHAAVLLTEYRRLGDRIPELLQGSFLAVLWDAQEERLLVFRDAIGLGSGYLGLEGSCLRVAPDIEWILDRRGADRAFNRHLLAELLRLRFHRLQASETFFVGVERLLPAHLLVVSARSVEQRVYWDPLPDGFEWNGDRELARFPEHLQNAVSACLGAGADSIALSGGFDSVSLAVLASEERGEKLLTPLHALSLEMPEPCNESETQRKVSAELGMPLSSIPLESGPEGGDFVASSLALSSGSPGPVLSLWQALYGRLLHRGRELGLRGLLFGTGGDDLLNVDPSYGADCLASLRLGSLARFFSAARRTSPFSTRELARTFLWSGALRPVLIAGVSRMSSTWGWTRTTWEAAGARHRRRRSPEFVRHLDSGFERELEARWRDARGSNARSWGDSYLATLRGLLQHPLAMMELEQGVAWSRRAGFYQFLPFYDRDLVSHLLRTHPEDLISTGVFKSPLRQFAAQRLPQVRLPSKKVDFSTAVHRALRRGCRPAWQRLGGAQLLGEMGVVDPIAADRFVHAYDREIHDRWLPTWLLLTSEAWLQANRSGSRVRRKVA